MPQILAVSMIGAVALGMGVWCLLRLRRATHPSLERTAWLVVLVVASVMPAMLTLLRDVAVFPGAVVPLPSAVIDAIDYTSRSIIARGARPIAFLGAAYFSIALALVLRVGIGLLLVRRLWRRATPVHALSTQRVCVRCTKHVESPVTAAAGVLLPADWTNWNRDALSSVLAHESSHVVRGDFFWQVLAQLHCALFWVSPLSWFLIRRLTILGEHLSDAAAIATARAPTDYSELLLEFSRAERTGFLMIGMARRSMLATRIEWILRPAGASTLKQPRQVAFHSGVIGIATLSAIGQGITLHATLRDATHVASRSVEMSRNDEQTAPPARGQVLVPVRSRRILAPPGIRLAPLSALATPPSAALAPLATQLERLTP
jgi:beta-lactamase regulating signal transducer with metallopeptidase domain